LSVGRRRIPKSVSEGEKERDSSVRAERTTQRWIEQEKRRVDLKGKLTVKNSSLNSSASSTGSPAINPLIILKISGSGFKVPSDTPRT